MPFLAPFAPALIKGGIALGSSLIGSKLLKSKPNPQEQNVLDLQQNQLQQGKQVYDSLAPKGFALQDQASGAYNPVIDYWSTILRGNRGGITSLMAPELNRINDSYDAATRSADTLLPRGGGRATLLQNLPYQKVRDQQTLLQTARPQAATNLLEAGRTAASTGEGLIQNAIAALNGGTNAGRSILDFNQQQRTADRATGNSIGNLVYDLIKNIKLGKSGGSSPNTDGGFG